jgi:serine/threonine protein kinase
MEVQDLTLKLPKHATPPPEGVSDSQMQNLMAAGAGAFDTQPTSSTRQWQPPTVAQLQQALPQYEITALIARGGMGAVYKGMQKALKRAVAIKVLPPEMEDEDMQFAARFQHEAQAMAQLSHPNIVAVFDAGEVVTGRGGDGETLRPGVAEPRSEQEPGSGETKILYFVMEFIEGTDVAQLIASEGRVEPPRAIQITTAVCEALAFAHEEGIIHRDIKPSNIMIDRKGRVKVADFGLAKTLNIESALMTRSEVAMGTPDFIAPEAMMPGMKVDGRADLYAVGVMLYQMLTGKIPRGRFELPSRVIPLMDKGFDAIVDKAMQTDRENRYSTATEMRTDVERVFQLVPAPDEATGRTSWKTRSTSRNPLLIITGAIILAVGTLLALKETQDSGPSETATAASPKSSAASPRPAEFRPAPITHSPKKVPAPFSLEQWRQFFPTPLPDEWETKSVYEDGLLYVKAADGFKKAMPSADGAIRAVVHLKTAKDTPTLFGRFSDAGGYYQAVWDVEHAVLFLAYYATGTGKGFEHLCSRTMPGDMIMKVGDVLKLELRLEGDHLTALINDRPLLDYHHDKLTTAGAWGIKSNTGAWFESVEIEPLPSPAQRMAESSRQTEPKPAQIADSPKKAPAPFSLEQWHELLPVEKPDAWERLSSYGDGLLYVKATVGFRRSIPSTADGVIRAVVRIKTENDNPMLFGRFSDQRGYYMAFWDVKSSMVGLSYYAIGSHQEYEHLGSRPLPKEMTMRVGDELKLELRLEGDHIIALTNGMPMLDFRHDKLKAPGEWGIKSLNGAWFESAEIEPLPSPVRSSGMK